jgi:hypothetical protein
VVHDGLHCGGCCHVPASPALQTVTGAAAAVHCCRSGA